MIVEDVFLEKDLEKQKNNITGTNSPKKQTSAVNGSIQTKDQKKQSILEIRNRQVVKLLIQKLTRCDFLGRNALCCENFDSEFDFYFGSEFFLESHFTTLQ